MLTPTMLTPALSAKSPAAQAQEQAKELTASAAEKVGMFLEYLELGNPSAVRNKLVRSGKEPFVVFRKNVARAATAPAAGAAAAGASPESSPRLTQGQLNAKEQAVADPAINGFPKSIRRQLRKVFATYCNARSAFGEQMGPSGFHRVCRECKLLDRNFGYAEADIILTHQDANADGATRKSDRRVNFEEFLGALRELAATKFPALQQGTPDDALADNPASAAGRLVHEHILRHGIADDRHPEIIKDLSTVQVHAHYKAFGNTLRGVFTHYAALDTISEAMRVGATWESISRTNRTINLDEFIMFALNFEIVPHLLPKFAMVGVFRASNTGTSADDHEEEMTYEEFIEALGRAALLVADVAKEKLSGKIHATITELSAVRRYVSYAETDDAFLYYESLDADRRRGAGALSTGGGTDISFREAAKREARAAVERALALEREVANADLDIARERKAQENSNDSLERKVAAATQAVLATGSQTYIPYAAFLRRERRPRTSVGMAQAVRRSEVATQARSALMRSLGVTGTLRCDVHALEVSDKGRSLVEYIRKESDGILAKPREIRRDAVRERRADRRAAKAGVAEFMERRPFAAPAHASEFAEESADAESFLLPRIVSV